MDVQESRCGAVHICYCFPLTASHFRRLKVGLIGHAKSHPGPSCMNSSDFQRGSSFHNHSRLKVRLPYTTCQRRWGEGGRHHGAPRKLLETFVNGRPNKFSTLPPWDRVSRSSNQVVSRSSVIGLARRHTVSTPILPPSHTHVRRSNVREILWHGQGPCVSRWWICYHA